MTFNDYVKYYIGTNLVLPFLKLAKCHTLFVPPNPKTSIIRVHCYLFRQILLFINFFFRIFSTYFVIEFGQQNCSLTRYSRIGGGKPCVCNYNTRLQSPCSTLIGLCPSLSIKNKLDPLALSQYGMAHIFHFFPTRS